MILAAVDGINTWPEAFAMVGTSASVCAVLCVLFWAMSRW